MRRILLLLLAAAVLAAPVALAKGAFPKTIPLPNGFQPEGIAIGKGTTFFVGSIPTGAIYSGDLRTGAGAVLVPGAAGRAATGLKYDHGRLFVSGAGTGKAFVYDAEDRRRPARVPARDRRRRDVRQRRRRHEEGRVLHRFEPGRPLPDPAPGKTLGDAQTVPADGRLPARERAST